MQEKLRIDAFLSAQLPDASRAKLQSSIKSGLVTVNGQLLSKASYNVRLGDIIQCQLPPPRPMEAVPEASARSQDFF